MDYIDKLKKKITNLSQVSTLTEDMIWQQHEPLIWQADRFEGTPFFNNVYRYKNYYSYSLLALILFRGRLNLNQYAIDKTREDFITPYVEPRRTVRRAYKKFSYLLPRFIHRAVGHHFQASVINRIWKICSNLQGAHMCFLRSITGMLVLSGYHGPNIREVISKVDFGEVCQNDLRPAIGKLLLGRDVYYPDANPWPKKSDFRKNLHKSEEFVSYLQKAGVEIINPADF